MSDQQSTQAPRNEEEERKKAQELLDRLEKEFSESQDKVVALNEKVQRAKDELSLLLSDQASAEQKRFRAYATLSQTKEQFLVNTVNALNSRLNGDSTLSNVERQNNVK